MQMELSDILTLVKAGYTRDEIEHMAQPTPVHTDPAPIPASVEIPEPDPEPVPAPAAEPAAAPVPVPAAQPVPAQQLPTDPAQPTMSDLMQSMAKLTSAIQANAIANSFIPGGSPRQPDASEVLGQIIRPTRGKKED